MHDGMYVDNKSKSQMTSHNKKKTNQEIEEKKFSKIIDYGH